MNRDVVVVYVFSFLAIAFFVLSFIPNEMTSFVTKNTIKSNVSVEGFFAIDFSINLNDGITFDEIVSLPSKVNASDNYNGVSSSSTLSVNVSSDSDVGVDFCIKANSPLMDSLSGETIGLGNETYSNSSINNLSSPSAYKSSPLTTNYVLASLGTSPGTATFYRFWLSVPSGVPSGNYNNSILFKGVQTTTGC